MTFRILAAVPLLFAAACSAPSVLPDAQALGLEPAQSPLAGAATTANLFPDYTPRTPVTAEEWRRLNREQAPAGSLP